MSGKYAKQAGGAILLLVLVVLSWELTSKLVVTEHQNEAYEEAVKADRMKRTGSDRLSSRDTDPANFRPSSGPENLPREKDFLFALDSVVEDPKDWELHGEKWFDTTLDIENPLNFLEDFKDCGSPSGNTFKTRCEVGVSYVLESNGDGTSTVSYYKVEESENTGECSDFSNCIASARIGKVVRTPEAPKGDLSAISSKSTFQRFPEYMHDAEIVKSGLDAVRLDQEKAKEVGFSDSEDPEERWMYEQGNIMQGLAESWLDELE